MTPRERSVWTAVYAAAYVAELERLRRDNGVELTLDIARRAARLATESVAALKEAGRAEGLAAISDIRDAIGTPGMRSAAGEDRMRSIEWQEVMRRINQAHLRTQKESTPRPTPAQCPYGPGHLRNWHRGHGCDLDPDKPHEKP